MVNLIQGKIDRRAQVIRGRGKSYGMMQGLDSDAAATLFIGYHARTGNDDGVLNHTMRGRDIQGVFLNDEPAGELRLNAAMAGWLGVPVVLIAGDNVLCAEGGRPWAGGGRRGQEGDRQVHRDVAASRDRPGADQGRRPARDRQRRGGRGGRYAPYRVEAPTTLRVAWNSTSIAAVCANLPGLKRVAPREVEYISADYPSCTCCCGCC